MKRTVLINPGTNENTFLLRVAAYCRVSTSSADQLNSYSAQIKYYTRYIKSKDEWIFTDIFADEGISGLAVENRPEFQRLIKACELKQIDLIITKSVSRFCRNVKETLEYTRKLKLLGVGVMFEKEGINTHNLGDEMLLSTFSAIAQEESVAISQNMRFSNKKRMKDGVYTNGSAPYGYRYVDKKLKPYEPEATIVKEIFQKYLNGKSSIGIANALNAKKIPCKGNNLKWSEFSILYILSNERYIGDSLFQKKYNIPDIPFTTKVNRGEKEQFYAYDTHSAIIDIDMFNATKDLLNRRKKHHNHFPSQAIKYPFTSCIRCSECGSFYRRRTSNGCVSWGCSKHIKDSKSCRSNYYREERIYDGFVAMVNKLKFGNTDIISSAVKQLEGAVLHRKRSNINAMNLSMEVSELTEKLLMIEKLRSKGYLEPEVYEEQARAIGTEIQKKKESRQKALDSKFEDVLIELRTLKSRLDEFEDILETFNEDLFNAIVKDIAINNRDEIEFTLLAGFKFTELL